MELMQIDPKQYQDELMQSEGVLAEVRHLEIVDDATFAKAVEYQKIGAEGIKAVKAELDPICTAAYQAHKEATALRSRLLHPWESLKLLAARKVEAYKDEQDRLRREEAERIRKIQADAEVKARAEREAQIAKARKEQEDKAIAFAAEAEAQGDTERAEMILHAAAEAPVIVPEAPPVVPLIPRMPEAPKVDGQYFRDNWQWEPINPDTIMETISREWLMLDTGKIGRHVRNFKKQSNIPEIRVWNDPTSVTKQ